MLIRSFQLLLVLIIVFFSHQDSVSHGAEEKGTSQAFEAISPQKKAIKLFNGKNLDGLYTWLQNTKYKDPKEVFYVKDQILHITGDGWGSIITKERYRDYDMILEYKWGPRTWHERRNRARDSGLFIHSTGIDGGVGGVWMPGIEVNIIEGGVGDFILVVGEGKDGQPVPLSLTSEVGRDRDGEVVWNKDGIAETFDLSNRTRINWCDRDPDWEDVLGFRGKNDRESPTDEWTRLEVVCRGGHIQVFVNGSLVNEAFDAVPAEGKLQLQAELAEILVRRWELLPLKNAVIEE
ncbi:3-keto-disaccharide hydrolase [Bythopirellula goksoeyrii]|uniref:3-keto-alpha-glucoside-1,2-lyase/3-keto-2-hydroxy-glucal hydratase domain-containing protein n=1 Tax=Bythopirellula goksoeyrii TaxID=1400387 RepID=A0A5B9Q6Q4_9BACT|nr:DUF1080 domain-containing protein [Bythopirellula goksoeyrii]QEG33399.1 hypothetical protein Pr1d_06620 [Bythopirellula goksoeyrii]